MTARKLPSFLNFNRSISPSEGYLYGVRSEDKSEAPVAVLRRGIRGSMSSFANMDRGGDVAASNEAKMNDPANANLQEVDAAFLPVSADRLLLRYSLIVQPNSLAPSGCNDVEFYQAMRRFGVAYAEVAGFDELAARYVWNVLNGRALWRNRFIYDRKVVVTANGETFTFENCDVPIDRFDRAALAKAEPLIAIVADALAGRTEVAFLNVDICGEAPFGAEVFPSQEFLSDNHPKKDKGQGKVLSKVSVQHDGQTIEQGTMHSQKIGNAIRCIDDWHGQAAEFGFTSVEAFGYVQSRSTALRVPGKKVGSDAAASDVFALLMQVDAITERLEATESKDAVGGDAHYLAAMLVRGGVFSGGSKDDTDKKAPKGKAKS